MATWTSRIILRNDSSFIIDEGNNESSLLRRGEVGVRVVDGTVQARIGVEGLDAWQDCPIIFEGSALSTPLSVEVPVGSGLADGIVLRWDPATGRFIADAAPIEIPTGQTGALVYDESEDRWEVDSAKRIPSELDGGVFNDGFEPPSFTSTITIGEPSP